MGRRGEKIALSCKCHAGIHVFITFVQDEGSSSTARLTVVCVCVYYVCVSVSELLCTFAPLALAA